MNGNSCQLRMHCSRAAAAAAAVLAFACCACVLLGPCFRPHLIISYTHSHAQTHTRGPLGHASKAAGCDWPGGRHPMSLDLHATGCDAAAGVCRCCCRCCCSCRRLVVPFVCSGTLCVRHRVQCSSCACACMCVCLSCTSRATTRSDLYSAAARHSLQQRACVREDGGPRNKRTSG